MRSVKNLLYNLISEQKIAPKDAMLIFKELQINEKYLDDDIAIIGMSGRLPNAKNPDEYWQNLREGINCITDIPAGRKEDIERILTEEQKKKVTYSSSGFLDNVDKFDASFFRISPKEAKFMEPEHRLFMEVVWEAIEDAGYPNMINGTMTGVYVGHDHVAGSVYKNYTGGLDNGDTLALTGVYPSILPSRISYFLDLHGPSIVYDTACSSGFVALHQACLAIKNKECEMAIAGGVYLQLWPIQFQSFKMVETSSNIVRTFDKNSSGTVWGEGVCAFLLKPLTKAMEDGDNIHAVIKGSAINNDGISSGITAPNAEAQESVITKAWEDSKVDVETITYIEAHGTGTVMGDPLEVKALRNAFSKFTSKKQFCGIGSLKPSIGHLVSASGTASLLKVILAMKHKEIPATINFMEPNAYINFSDSQLYVNDKLQKWEDESYPRRAGISSFGFSGTNCHMVIEESPEVVNKSTAEETGPYILVLSAKNRDVLKRMVQRYRKFLEKNPLSDLKNICFTATAGRCHYENRLAFIINSRTELKEKLDLLSIGNFSEFKEKGIYFGTHKIVNKHSRENAEGELTQNEKEQLARDINSKIAEMLKSKEDNETILDLVCQYYIKGTDIKWVELIYQGMEVRKISLPTYPFEKTRYWYFPEKVESNEQDLNNVNLEVKDNITHPLNSGMDNKKNINHVVLLGKTASEFTETETVVGHIWANILGIYEIDIYDSFYNLGGDSILATQMVYTINSEYTGAISISDIFTYPTVSELSIFIDEQSKKNASHYLTLVPVKESEYYPLLSAQRRLFIINEISDVGICYNIPVMIPIDSKIKTNKEQLEGIFNDLIKRHEALRTSITVIDGEPVQVVHNSVDFKLQYVEAEECLLGTLIDSFIQPFDLSKAPLFRAILINLSSNRQIIMTDMHHIVSDGTSVNILMNEVRRLASGDKLPELKLQYKDFAVWHNQLLKSEMIAAQEKYWLEVFAGDIPILNLQTDYPRPPFQQYDGGRVRVRAEKELTQKLKKITTAAGVTMYMALFAAYNTLLYKYTDQEDIIVGSPIAGRQNPGTENIIGLFVNTLVMRNYPEGNKTFLEFLQEVKRNALKAFENQDYQYEEMVNKLDFQRDFSRNPLFDTVFILQNHIKEEMTNFLEFENNTSKFDITLEALEADGEISFEFEYCTRLFKEDTMLRFAEHYINILKQITEDPEIKLINIDMLSEKEKSQILVEFNNTNADYPKEKTIHQMFEEQAQNNPDRIALIFEGKQLTYSELNAKVNQLARILKEKGVERNSIVGIMEERSPEMMISIMGVLKAGGAYLPIDPTYPRERIQYMLNDSGTKLLLSQVRFSEMVSEFQVETIFTDEEQLYLGDTSNPIHTNTSTDLAYVIYTSGSTGKPKGVMIEHFSLINRLNWMQKKYPIGEDDVILQKTPFTFDVSVWELFWWGIQGAKVCFLKPGGEKEPEEIIIAIEKHKVTTMHFVPSMLNTFLEYIAERQELDRMKSLRQVFASGEALRVQQVIKFNEILYERFTTQLHNLYGPTEAAIDVSYFDCLPEDDFISIPIGKPIDNIKLYVLNKSNKLQPIGVTGELYIAGDGLARGYLNKPDLTAEKFVASPFLNGERMYRTGDLARWLPDGNIEYLGRMDYQVKVRGFRIELGEIESELLTHKMIQEAAVTVQEDNNGNKYLCAYLVSSRVLESLELRRHLGENLPDYMIPQYFVQLEKIPLTSNGKVDRKALKAVEGSMKVRSEYVEPRNEIERELAEVWQQILGIDRVSVNDNFFELGGNSLKAIQVVGKLKGYYLNTNHILQNPTIAQLQSCIVTLEYDNVEIPKLMRENLEIEYHFLKNGDTDPLTTALDCGSDMIYFALKKNIKNMKNFSQYFLDGFVPLLTQNTDGSIFDINSVKFHQEESDNINYFIKGNGFESISQIEDLLDKGEQVMVMTTNDRLPFHVDFKGFDLPADQFKINGHTFMFVAHDKTRFYYVDMPSMINTENFIPYPGNKSVGMVKKEDLRAAFDIFLQYATIPITEDGGDKSVNIRDLVQMSKDYYYKDKVSENGFTYSYGINALNTMLELCKKNVLVLTDMNNIDPYKNFRDLIGWRFWHLAGRRRIFRLALMDYKETSNQDVKIKLMDILDCLDDMWIYTSDYMTVKYNNRELIFGSDYVECLEQIKDKEEELIYYLDKLWD